MDFQRIFVIDLVSLGVGAAKDADKYDSIGADTLGHVMDQSEEGFSLPELTSFGLGNIRRDSPVNQLAPVENPKAYFGKLGMQSHSNGFNVGLREMFDYNTNVRTTSLMDDVPTLSKGKCKTIIISNYQNYLANQLHTENISVGDDADVFRELHRIAVKPQDGLIYVRISGLHRRAKRGDTKGYRQVLSGVDGEIHRLAGELFESDLLIVTSSYANDPALKHRFTREYLPLLVYFNGISVGQSLGNRNSTADIGATIADVFGITLGQGSIGKSFLSELQ